MKHILLFGNVVLLSMICGIGAITAHAQDGEQQFVLYWQEKDATFADAALSPLNADAIAHFDSIPRFTYNEKFRVEAQWQPIEAAKPQQVLTSTGSKRLMQKAGLFKFAVDGVEVALYVYRDLTMQRMKPGSTSLFLPFTDLSNGETTYMGGRYMDLDEAIIKSSRVTLDFNLAYNPYCVYSDKYSCPIPPSENRIALSINAGARVDQ